MILSVPAFARITDYVDIWSMEPATWATLTGEQKKALALEAVGDLFDAVADRAVPPIAWPVWIVARPAVRSLVLALASGAIEQLLPLVRSK